MVLDFMLKVFEENIDQDAIVWKNKTYTYGWLLERFNHWLKVTGSKKMAGGTVTALEADFSPDAVALFLALAEKGSILVPLTSAVRFKREEYIATARAEVVFSIDSADKVTISESSKPADHELYRKLREANHPGLVILSSGSTGKCKATVHDFTLLLEKFKTRRKSYRTLPFLLYDHIGGINTMLHTLSNAGCLVTVQDRSPDGVLKAVEKHGVELLPTSPTFINLVLISEAYKNYDLSSLKIITYGTEPMPESTLKRFHELFPQIKLFQNYGLTEVGILRTRSISSDSLWIRLDGEGSEGFETRVVDGILQIKARSAMLGYLNAPSPYTEDGWLHTGDRVEVDGESIRFLGRESEIINVGGEKVYPAEVESVLQEMENVAEVTVYGEKNPITGSIVCARVRLRKPENPKEVTVQLKQFCRKRLEEYKIPVKVIIDDKKQYSSRYKKVRTV